MSLRWGPVVGVTLASACGAARLREVPPIATHFPSDRPDGGPPGGEIRAVIASELCVSEGHLQAAGARQLRVDSGGMRATVAGDASPVVELDFTYRGPSSQTIPLASGELRRQIGLKLRAKDTCNVVYVMWHAEPMPGIFVSVKHNPGASKHEDCGDHGYINLQAATSASVPRLLPDERHTLRAELDADTLRVIVDGAVAWTGVLPPQAFGGGGPAGIRTDNGVFDFELRVAHAPRAGARCKSP